MSTRRATSPWPSASAASAPRRRSPSPPRPHEWRALGHTVYPFHLGDMDLPTPENVVEAAFRAIRDGKTGYCPNAGIPELREALAADVGASHGMTYGPENVAVQPGGKPVIEKFLLTLMDPGDEVLYPSPGFPIYESQIEFLGGVAKPYGFVPGERRTSCSTSTPSKPPSRPGPSCSSSTTSTTPRARRARTRRSRRSPSSPSSTTSTCSRTRRTGTCATPGGAGRSRPCPACRSAPSSSTRSARSTR